MDNVLTSSDHLDGGSGQKPVIVASLLSIAKSTRAFLALLLAEIDLHPGQDQLLDRLEPATPISVSALADALSVRPSTVSKMLDRLIDKGLVARESSSSDARRTMVRLTEEGVGVQLKVRQLWDRFETDLVSAIEAPELRDLDGALMRIGDLLSQKLRRLR
ncbi:MarR family transcriptional regulator [Aurantimonas sp. Leaf443]|uniref:MarR family winged helix-turn-helix transcriptional regulator n=1 Tax=Aurantimonas sp. Leaf443 TaxID=1736378 RepID=UPI0006FA70EB|nr:MarR family transcriptional regulator [Aurantimonas sp. Leaf443]KQT83069.1 transcriptional regulator [Aurantimonas sp. Leaf443]